MKFWKAAQVAVTERMGKPTAAQKRAVTKETQVKAEKALTDAAKRAGKLEALQPAKAATKKQH